MAVAGVSFAKVSVSASRAQPASGPLEVVTRSGHSVRVTADFDEAALLRLLSVLLIAKSKEKGVHIGLYAERLLGGALPWTKMRQAYALLGLRQK
jgi:hypothetical protein